MLTKTDILVLKLEPDQAAGIADLDQFLHHSPADDEPLRTARGRGGLFARLRARLSGRRI